MVSKIRDRNSISIELSCETNFFFSVESLTLTNDRLTITKRIKIIKTYYKNGNSATVTYRALRGDYGLHNRPTPQAIGKIVEKFEETVMVTNIRRPVHRHFACSTENIAFVCRSQQLRLSYGTLWRIMHLDLHLHPYTV